MLSISMQSGSQQNNSGPDVKSILRQVFLGNQQIVSHVGVSQFQASGSAGTGRSACGLAALNCARIVFDREERGIRNKSLLRQVLARETAEEINSICVHWNSPFHLDMEDILRVPWFSKSLSLVDSPSYCLQCDFTGFLNFLREMTAVSPSTSAAAMITRPPEIIACLKIHTSKGDVFLIFDSHIRPNHPYGAGFILNTSMAATATYLADLFKIDEHCTDKDTQRQLQWQVELMKHFNGHIFVSKRSDGSEEENTNQTLLESSMTILKLNAELAAMKSDNTFLTNELEMFRNSVAVLENMRDRVHERASKPTPQRLLPSNKSVSTWGKITSVATTSRLKPVPSGQENSPATSRSKPTPSGQVNSLLTTIRSKPAPSGQENSRDADNNDHMFALQLQWDIDNENASVENAAIEQQRYEMEDRRLAEERETLAAAFPMPFQCGICLDDHSIDSVARITKCEHPFCRTCLRDYVRSKLSERVYPIFCPICVTEQGASEPASIDEGITRLLGFTEEEYSIFDELQISAYSIQLHCRRCKQTMFVDRQEHQESKVLVCPLPGCLHVWCKSCQQTIDTSGPRHSCDGSSELNHLMERSGWRYCPGCKTPIQKESGCNHMTCMAPGCNTHFCYRCGDSIIKSALRREVNDATNIHYQRCTLFEELA